LEKPSDAGKTFEWLLPPTHYEALYVPHYPKPEITEVFTAYDINNVRTADPKLFGSSDSIVIDIGFMRQAPYSLPLPGAKVISPFGGRRKRHVGIDLKTFKGDTVRASFDGIIRMAKSYSGYGNVIVIRHYNGLETVYSHNAAHLVKQGARVKAGTPIALVGRTGRATTEHVHFEVRLNGKPFNPSLLFDMQTGELLGDLLIAHKDGRIHILDKTM
jgi:murein DD-endopeptidase MepM/ murein hydrolase activator NlpD